MGEGTPLVLVESEQGVASLTRDQVKALVRADLAGVDLAGVDLVGKLLAQRRRESDAEGAAALWTAGSGRSRAHRLCLALARRLDATVWTADAHWGSSATIRQIR